MQRLGDNPGVTGKMQRINFLACSALGSIFISSSGPSSPL